MDDVTLTQTVAATLATRTGWAWQPASPYTVDQVGIFYGPIGTTPDKACGIRVYLPSDDLATGLKVRQVQLRFRGTPGDPAGADVLADQAFSALHGLARVAGLNLVTRVSMAQLGADDNGRQERTDNYQIILDNPEA